MLKFSEAYDPAMVPNGKDGAKASGKPLFAKRAFRKKCGGYASRLIPSLKRLGFSSLKSELQQAILSQILPKETSFALSTAKSRVIRPTATHSRRHLHKNPEHYSFQGDRTFAFSPLFSNRME